MAVYATTRYSATQNINLDNLTHLNWVATCNIPRETWEFFPIRFVNWAMHSKYSQNARKCILSSHRLFRQILMAIIWNWSHFVESRFSRCVLLIAMSAAYIIRKHHASCVAAHLPHTCDNTHLPQIVLHSYSINWRSVKIAKNCLDVTNELFKNYVFVSVSFTDIP